MKKYIGVLGVMTILSGCGTGLDFWNSKDPNPLATSGRRAPALNNGIGGMPTPPNPMMGMNAPQPDSFGMPPVIDDSSMPPYPGAQGSIPMPPPPPEFNSPSPMGYAAQALPDGRRAPKFNQTQFAQAPAPYVSQQPIPAPYEPVAAAPAPAPVAPIAPAPYQVTTITPEYRDTGVATLPPPPPPPTQFELAAQTNASELQPLGGKSVSEVEVNMGVEPAPTKIIVPVKSPDAPQASTDYRDLKPISASSPVISEESTPKKVVVNIQPSGKRYDDSGYPVLANIPPAPAAPAPLQEDARVAELKQDYSNSVSQAPTNGQVRITSNGFNASDIPPPPPPLPYEAAPAPQAPAKITVPVKSAPPMKEASVEAPRYVEPPVPAYNSAPAPASAGELSGQPTNALMPQGPTVVIRSKNSGKSSTTSAKPFHTSTEDTVVPQPTPVAQAEPVQVPVQVLPAQTVAVNEVAMQPVTSQTYSQPPMQYQPASAPVVTVTASGASSEYPVASTNVDDLHPIAAASGTGHSYKPLLAQSRYSAMRAQARNSTRY